MKSIEFNYDLYDLPYCDFRLSFLMHLQILLDVLNRVAVQMSKCNLIYE